MKCSFSLLLKKHLYELILFVFILWLSFGVFPLVCYESDGISIITGCEYSLKHGISLPLKSHEYAMQPMISLTILAFNYLLPFFNCEQIYCFLSAITSVLFILGSVHFISNVEKTDKIIALLFVLLIPESYMIGMYPNSAIFAGTLFIWAIILLRKGLLFFSLILLCIAPLFRLDIIIVYPTILPLWCYSGKTMKWSLKMSIVFALIVVLTDLIMFHILKADILETLFSYQEWSNGAKIPKLNILVAFYAFASPVYLLLIPLGCYSLIKFKKFRLLSVVLVPIFLNLFIYRSMGSASKHYLYIVPFVTILGINAYVYMKELLKTKKRWLQYIPIVLILIYLMVSVKIEFAKRPWWNQTYSLAKLGPQFHFIKFGNENIINMGFGIGQMLNTADERAVASGNLFYPFYINNCKQRLIENRERVYNLLKEKKECTVFTIPFMDYSIYTLDLLFQQNDLVFDYKKDGYLLYNRYGNRSIEFLHGNDRFHDIKDLKDYIKETITVKYRNVKSLYIVTTVDKHIYALDELSNEMLNLKKLSQNTYKVN